MLDVVITHTMSINAIDHAIDVIENRRESRSVAMSCSRLWWSTAAIIRETYSVVNCEINPTADPVRVTIDALVGKYQHFMCGEEYEHMPHWWNQDADKYYDERIDALNSFRAHVVEQGNGH